MQNKKEKLLALLIGIIMVFISLEIFLRVGGHLTGGKKSVERIRRDSQYTILCLGNSHTRGEILKRDNETYPSQLESMLIQSTKESIKVINRGITDLNSAEMLRKIDGWLKEAEPDLIILRTGEPNLWNHYHYSNYLQRSSKNKLPFKKACSSLYDLLYQNIRVFRLAVLLKNKVKLRTERAAHSPYRPGKDGIYCNYSSGYRQACNFYRSHKQSRERGEAEISQAQFDWLIKELRQGIELCPQHPKNYRYLATVYRWKGEERKEVNWLIEGIKANPGWRAKERTVNKNYHRLLEVREEVKEPTKRLIDRFIANFTRRYPQYSENLVPTSMKKLKPWLRSDLQQIIHKIRERNISLILHNYHPRPNGEGSWLPTVNQILEETAKGYNIAFVNNEKAFNRIFHKKSREDLYIQIGGDLDVHLNKEGQKITAELLFQAIKNQGLLNLTYNGQKKRSQNHAG